ncbi:thiamine pyrophosphate-binding protein [Pseudonocardia hydrocarbonoxydans]|uniref:Acetolactate synthase n=1 Tax=Pseudonocardia hydrocarbonoxydans TaxID=76726 RepID=A0A4Y3WME1_9PSEU|nr:thiamine pyrophosphate-dependent enzyme [Pseudonocardia hydrocarbonoxydans]GEC20003.1 acetolactate synthase [Pseudonocardia hydrocarbonoxydans]
MDPTTTRGLADALADGLLAAGVRRIFGVPGGGPNLDVVGAAAERGIGFVLTHGETAACIAASTYGRLTGTPGTALVTRGPGLTSAANGLAHATLDRAPLLVVSDTVTAATAARTAHQRLDQVGAAAPLTRWSGTLGHTQPAAVAEAAARLALRSPPGAVHLAFDPTTAGDPPPTATGPSVVDPGTLARARALVAGARRPVVVVGVDATVDGAAVRRALAGLDCPVLVTYAAKGVVPESGPTFAGLFTGAAVERPLLAGADLVLGIGLDAVEAVPGPWPTGAPVVLAHSHPVETAYFGDPLLLVGPYATLLPALLADAAPDWPPGAGRRAHDAVVERLGAHAPAAAGTLGPLDVVRTTRAVLGDVPLTVDAGAHMLVTMPLWSTDGPDPVLISNGLATMGFALPAAIGAALARPGRRVACLTGDGGLGMAMAEIETLARLALDVTVVVFNDAALTLIALKQGDAQGGGPAVTYAPTDFAAVAVAMGVPGVVARSVEELRGALGSVRRGPLLVDARVDPGPYRHVIRTIRG